MEKTMNPSCLSAQYWDSMPREEVRPGVSRCAFRGDQVLLVMNWLQPGMEVRPHSHPFEQVVYVVRGKMKFWIDGSEVEVGEGGMLRIPPDAEHCGAPIGDEIVMNLDVFSPIREDYLHLVEYQANDF
jgi:quercetin dioxygenase-like cupin family protein